MHLGSSLAPFIIMCSYLNPKACRKPKRDVLGVGQDHGRRSAQVSHALQANEQYHATHRFQNGWRVSYSCSINKTY